MKIQLKKIEELDEEIKFEIWIDEVCYKSYSRNRFPHPELAAEQEYDALAKKAGEGFPKETIIKETEFTSNTNKVTSKIKTK